MVRCYGAPTIPVVMSPASLTVRSTLVTGLKAATPVRGTALQVAAAVLWIPQAGIIALIVHQLANGQPFQWAIPWVAAFFITGLLRSLLDALGNRLAFAQARTSLTRLRMQVVQSFAEQSPFDPARTASGAAASALNEQADAILPYLSRFMPARAKAAWVPLIIVAAAAWFSWAVALVLVLAAPLIPLFMALVGWRARQASEAQLGEMSDMTSFLLDRLRGMPAIRALDAVAATANQVTERAVSLRGRIMAVLRLAFLSSAVLELFAALGVAMVAVYVGFHLLGELDFGAWGGKLTLGEALFLLLLSPAFFEPLRELAAAWHDRAAGQAALEKLACFHNIQLRVVQPDNAGESYSSSVTVAHAPSLQLTNLAFRYPGRHHDTIKGLTLTIHPEEHIAVVGPSGVGKSTLLAVLAGLLPVSHGDYRVDGLSPTDASSVPLRSRIAWVGQQPHIFAGSLIGNVCLGRQVPDHLLRYALHLAALERLVEDRGHVPLAEGGAGMSAGELVRLSIARAAVNPQAGLVLADEPTAHLDRATADDVAERLYRMARGRTLIVVTHDESLAARAHRTIRLDTCSQSAVACVPGEYA